MLSFLSKSLFKKLPLTPLLKPSPFFPIHFCSYFATSKKDFTEKFMDDKIEPKKEKAFKRGDVSTSPKPKKINDASKTNKTEKLNKPKFEKQSEKGKSKKVSQGLSEQIKKQMEKIENNPDFEAISRPNKKNKLGQTRKETIKDPNNKSQTTQTAPETQEKRIKKVNREKSERPGQTERHESQEKPEIQGLPLEKSEKTEKKEKKPTKRERSVKKPNIPDNQESQEKLEIKEEPISQNQPENKIKKQHKKEKSITQEKIENQEKPDAPLEQHEKEESKEKKGKIPKKKEKKVKVDKPEKNEKPDSDPELLLKSQEPLDQHKKIKKPKKVKKEIAPETTEPSQAPSSQSEKSETPKINKENQPMEHLSKESIFSRPNSEPIESQQKLKHFQSGMETIELPWDFHSLIVKPKGTCNLMSAVDVMKFLKESKVKSMLKDFLESLEENNTDNLSKLLEFSFFRKLQKSLEKLKERNLKLEVENLHSKRTELGVYNISNFFTIGVNANRMKNDAKSNYKIVQNSIGGVPTMNIIHVKQENIQNIKIFVQLDIVVTSDFGLKIKDQDGKTILGETQLKEQNQDEVEAVKGLVGEAVPEIIMKKFEKKSEVKRSVHMLKIEGCIFEGDYSFFENQMKDGNLEKWRKENNLTVNKDSFYIVDFDNYMNGNELVGDVIKD